MVKQIAHARRNEPRKLGIPVTVTPAVATVVVAKRKIYVKRVLRTGHRDIEQPALLVHPRVIGGGHIGRDHPIGGVDNVDDVPLATLRRMDRAQDEKVLVQVRRTGKIGG